MKACEDPEEAGDKQRIAGREKSRWAGPGGERRTEAMTLGQRSSDGEHFGIGMDLHGRRTAPEGNDRGREAQDERRHEDRTRLQRRGNAHAGWRKGGGGHVDPIPT